MLLNVAIIGILTYVQKKKSLRKQSNIDDGFLILHSDVSLFSKICAVSIYYFIIKK